jgi:GH43 family beta-xylosidase
MRQEDAYSPLEIRSPLANPHNGAYYSTVPGPFFYNPILEVPDPFVTRFNGIYYMTGTTGWNVTVWSSPRLETVSQKPTIVWAPHGEDQPNSLIWSPSMFRMSIQGVQRWFIYFTGSTTGTDASHRIYVLQSSSVDPLGPYTFMGRLRGTREIPTIDPSVLRVNNQDYILYVVEEDFDGRLSNVIHIAPLADPLAQSRPSIRLTGPDQPWEKGASAHQAPNGICEGPEALQHSGRIFVVYSATDTSNYNYCLGLLTLVATDPFDAASWRKEGPVFQHCTPNGVFGPGRATFALSPDGTEDWMVYHGKTTATYTSEGRTTRAQRFSWRPDGRPDFGFPVSLQQSLKVPAGE